MAERSRTKQRPAASRLLCSCPAAACSVATTLQAHPSPCLLTYPEVDSLQGREEQQAE